MTEDQQDDRPSGPGSTSAGFEDDASLKNVADLLWEGSHGAPPLREDPVAAMLGLLPDPAYALDSAKLKRARKVARLQTSDLVARLTTRGWTVDNTDLFRWENQSTADVAPALIKALAEETGTNSDLLVTKQPKKVPSAIAAALGSPLFFSLTERWARLQNVTQSLARSELESRMLTTVYRGDDADTDQMLQSLEALVTASENAKEPHREP